MLLLAVSGLATALFKTDLMQAGSAVFLIYSSWAIMLFYKKGVGNFFKALFAYLLGCFCFMVVALMIGRGLDLYLPVT